MLTGGKTETGASLNISVSQPNFWKGIEAFHGFANTFVDAGLYVWYSISTGTGLSVQPFVAPNMTTDQFTKVLQPLLAQLAALNVTYKMDTPTAYPTFYDLYHSVFAPSPYDSGSNNLVGGRLFSKDDVAANNAAIVAAIQGLVEAGHTYGGRMVNPGRAVPDATGNVSAAHPVWRNSAESSLWTYATDACSADRKKTLAALTAAGDALRKASPKSAVYSNEVSTHCHGFHFLSSSTVLTREPAGRRRRAQLAGRLLGIQLQEAARHQDQVRRGWRLLGPVDTGLREVGAAARREALVQGGVIGTTYSWA